MGIDIRPGKLRDSIRLVFTYKGVVCKETLKGLNAKNDKHMGHAEKMLAAIEYDLLIGNFDYLKHFPNSNRSKLFGVSKVVKDITLQEAIDTWMVIKSAENARSTTKNYKSKIDNHILPAFGNRILSTISKAEINDWITKDKKHLSNKTINEMLMILKSVYKDAVENKLITESPLDSIKYRKTITMEPDPFELDEIQKISDTDTKRVQEVQMMIFNMWTGLRMSELIALSWDDIDMENWNASICRAKVEGYFKKTKTKGSTRTIELLSPAIDSLKILKEYSFNLPPLLRTVTLEDNKTTLNEEWRPIFINTNTNKPHANTNTVCHRFWQSHLKKAGVRYRPSGQSRHTYASQLLSTGGISKEWIAMQMGHTNTRMIDEHYAKWMKGQGTNMTEIANAALGFNNK